MGKLVKEFWLPETVWNFLYGTSLPLALRTGTVKIKHSASGEIKAIDRGGRHIASYLLLSIFFTLTFAVCANWAPSRVGPTKGLAAAAASGLVAMVLAVIIATRKRCLIKKPYCELEIAYYIWGILVGTSLVPAMALQLVVCNYKNNEYFVVLRSRYLTDQSSAVCVGLAYGIEKDMAVSFAVKVAAEFGISVDSIVIN